LPIPTKQENVPLRAAEKNVRFIGEFLIRRVHLKLTIGFPCLNFCNLLLGLGDQKGEKMMANMMREHAGIEFLKFSERMFHAHGILALSKWIGGSRYRICGYTPFVATCKVVYDAAPFWTLGVVKRRCL